MPKDCGYYLFMYRVPLTPNAITLTTFSGSTPTNDGWIVVIVLAAAALLAGGWVLRRRTQA